VAITGSNYFALYAGILLALLLLVLKDSVLFRSFGVGASLGLIHLPSVAYLLGQPRGNAESSIPAFSVSLPGVLSSLAVGIGLPLGLQSWAMVGVPCLILFLIVIVGRLRDSIGGKPGKAFTAVEGASLFGMLIMILLATGVLYQWQHMLDTFRVPARAITFVALALTLYILEASRHDGKATRTRVYLLASALQIVVMSFMIRPYGAAYGPYDPKAQELADVLLADNARSVWISMQELTGSDKRNSMYIQAALMRNGLSLPNVYYGDMGQKVTIHGDSCGYSFDHLVTLSASDAAGVNLTADIDWSGASGWISARNLTLVDQIDVNGRYYSVFRIVCDLTGGAR
jgi:hypothetical protein